MSNFRNAQVIQNLDHTYLQLWTLHQLTVFKDKQNYQKNRS